MALKVACDLDSGVDGTGFYGISRMVADVSRRTLSSSKPITGETVFLHESGIHCSGLLRNRATYEAFPSRDVGRCQQDFVIGRHSSFAAVEDVCLGAGFRIDREGVDLNELMRRVRLLARLNRGKVTPDQVMELIPECRIG
jgi:homocitrate synthase NifV